MNILVLGASSRIGFEIAAEFSADNHLLLVGRNASRLRESADRCRERGAERTIELSCDLRHGCGEILRASSEWQIDMVINAAAATSRLRDQEITMDELGDLVRADLLAPIELVSHLLAHREGRPLNVIFISTILTLVRSPNRTIYSDMKRIHEQCLRMLRASHSGLYVLIVKVAKVIPPDKPTQEATRLAEAVRAAFAKRKNTVVFGTAGRLMTALYYTQPALFNLAVRMRRRIWPAPDRRYPEG